MPNLRTFRRLFFGALSCPKLALPAAQAYVSRARVESFSLIADMMYVSSNAPRISRAIFEICLRRGWSATAELALRLCKAFELRWCGPHRMTLQNNEMGR